jgi:putative transposase
MSPSRAFDQEAELKAIRAAFPDYAAIHSHLLHDALARLDKTDQAFFRRLQRRTTRQRLPGAADDRAHRQPLVAADRGAPKTVTIAKEADGWSVAISCADVPRQPLPSTGQETSIDVGIEAFATLSDGTRIFSPSCCRKAERYLAKCQRRAPRRMKGGRRRRKAVTLLAKAHQTARRQRQDVHQSDGALPHASV